MEKDLSQKSFHVHQVLDMMSIDKRALTLIELKELIGQKFGDGASFESCSMNGMNPTEVIEFLLGREKIYECEPGKFQLNIDNACGH